MQFLRVGGQRACSTRQQLCGVFGGSGRAGEQEEASWAKAQAGHAESAGPWKTVEASSVSTSICRGSATCSPLQFVLDDLASPSGQPIRAFRRAVCLPFQPAPGVVRAALERKVRWFLLDSHAHVRCCDVPGMASILREQGLHASIVLPGELQSRKYTYARCIGSPFLVVTSDNSEEVVVVDAALRDHLQVAPCTPAYQRTLVSATPNLFVGSLARLQQLVTSMAAAIATNFSSLGVDVPPWRRTSALLARWTVVQQRQAEIEAQRRASFESSSEQSQDAPRCVPPPVHRLAPTARHCGSDCAPRKDGVLLGVLDGQTHGGSGAVPAHPAFVVVRGFEVGSPEVPARAAWERGVWPSTVKPGGLASLCRKEMSSQANAGSSRSSSSADSHGVWGASPSSVFQSD